jgi:hypothetical protein
MSIQWQLHEFQNRVFDIVVYITWILYIVILLGLSSTAPQYLSDLEFYVKLYVSLFLIFRFNPFRRVRFTGLDAKIAFSAGLFLFGTTAISSILQSYLGDITKKIKSHI